MTDLLTRAHQLAARLPAVAADHEAARRRPSPDVVDALRADGFLQVLLPRAQLGGLELDAPTYVDVLAALAAGDAATAWCVMTASTSTLLAGHPRAPRRRGALGRRAAAMAGRGVRAQRDRDRRGRRRAPPARPLGLRLRLPPRRLARGRRPGRRRAAAAPRDLLRADCRSGGRDRRSLGHPRPRRHRQPRPGRHRRPAPAHLVASVFERTPWPAGALHRLPLFGLLALGIAACGLGLATAAVDHGAHRLVSASASGKAGEPSSSALVGHAALVAQLGAARAYLVDVAARARPPPARARRPPPTAARCAWPPPTSPSSAPRSSAPRSTRPAAPPSATATRSSARCATLRSCAPTAWSASACCPRPRARCSASARSRPTCDCGPAADGQDP